MAAEIPEPGRRQLWIHSHGWLLARRLTDDEFGFYVMLVIHSEADPLIPAHVVKHFAGRRRKRYLRELDSMGFGTPVDSGALRLSEYQPMDHRWRYFGPRDHWEPFAKVGLARRPDREYLPRRVRAAVVARDGMVCGICGLPVANSEGFDIDHVIPLARGGTDDIDNLQVAHASCNRRKGARILAAGMA